MTPTETLGFKLEIMNAAERYKEAAFKYHDQLDRPANHPQRIAAANAYVKAWESLHAWVGKIDGLAEESEKLKKNMDALFKELETKNA